MRIVDNKGMRKIMFTGHRDCIADKIALENIAQLYDDCLWLHGGAAGFDEQVEAIAAKYSIKTEVHKPDYKTYASKQAPIIRNREMLNACDMVIACYDGRQNGGTFFVVTEARKAKKKVVILSAQHQSKSKLQVEMF